MTSQRLIMVLDVSARQGMGHLQRCLAIARVLHQHGGEPELLCVGTPGQLDGVPFSLHVVAQAGDELAFLADRLRQHTTTQLLIDHYRADPEYQQQLIRMGARWAQFDYRKAFPIKARWVININPQANPNDYADLVSADTRLLLGSRYAILRDHFTSPPQREYHQLNRVLVMLGAGDDRGLADHLLDNLPSHLADARITLVTTRLNPNLPKLRRYHEYGRLELLVEPPNLATLMREHDLGICTAGTTAFEFASQGLPFICLAIADNQVAICDTWQQLGVALSLGRLDPGLVTRLHQALDQISDPELRRTMSGQGPRLVDDQGAHRIVSEIIQNA